MTGPQPASAKARRRWYQYRLRTLLLLVTVCALACSWLALPTARAHRFVAAAKSGDFDRIQSMFSRPNNGFPGTATQAKLSELEVAPLTLGQLLRGERFVSGYVPYGPELHTLDCHVVFRVTGWNITVHLYLHG